MSIVTLKDNRASLKNTLKWSEPVDDIGHLRPTFLKSSSVNPFSLLLLLYDRGLSVLFKSELARELEVYSDALSPASVQPALISYTWAKPGFQAAVVETRGKMPTLPSQSPHPPTKTHLLSHKEQEKSKYDTNLTIIILKMGQATSELLSACFSELQHCRTSIKCCLLICLSETPFTLQKLCSVSYLPIYSLRQ